MNVRALTGLIFLVSLAITTGAVPAIAQQTDKPPQRVRFVCQAFDIVDYEFRNRVMILEQTSTKPLDTYPNFDLVDGSFFIDMNSGATYYTNHMGMTDLAEFRLRIYRTSLISEDKTEEEIIKELLKNPGDLRVVKNPFQDHTPMDYIGSGFRFGSVFSFSYEREKDGFLKEVKLFIPELYEFYERKEFNVDNLGDLDTDSFRELDYISFSPCSIRTNAASVSLVEDGACICRKPVLLN